MHIRDVNFTGIYAWKASGVFSSNSIEMRFSYLYVLHLHERMSGGREDVHARCGRLLLLMGDARRLLGLRVNNVFQAPLWFGDLEAAEITADPKS